MEESSIIYPPGQSMSHSADGPTSVMYSAQWSKPTLLRNGSYCALYVATKHGKRFILKGLRPEYQDSPLHQQMLRREFEIGISVEHPNIVRTLDFPEMEGIGSCIQLEYVSGRTLGEFLAENPTAAMRKRVLEQLLDAVGYIHANRILHRDIKPANILITTNGNNVRLIDFGLSDEDDYLLHIAAGTAGFAAPEQATHCVVDSRADIYALGCIIRLLFPSRYRYIVRRCLAQNVSGRYDSCETLSRSIRRYDRWSMIAPVMLVTILLLVSLCFTLYRQHGQQQMIDEYQLRDNLIYTALQTVDSIFDEHVAQPFDRGEIMYMEDFGDCVGRAMPLMVEYCNSFELAHPGVYIRSEAYARWAKQYNRIFEEKRVATLPFRWRETRERK